MKNMKTIKIIAALCFAAGMATSCAVHDPFADKMDIGQVVPTVTWELGSTVAKSGEWVKFTGKYYVGDGKTIDRSEVWGMTVRTEVAAATCKLTTSLNYTKTINKTDTVRQAVLLKTIPHSKATWDGYEYVLVDSFQVSSTFSPIVWGPVGTWDESKFNTYFPEGFQEEFKATVVNYLTKDSVYYNDLRGIYINYDFTAEQFEAVNSKYGVNLPTETESGKKSDLWTTTDVIDHYYYITISEDGKKIEHEIANESDAPAGVKTYPVYKSSEWVYCRYSDDTGGKIQSVRPAYMKAFKDLIEQIPFIDWIYNSTDKVYTATFTRNYSLVPFFRVYDNTGKMGTDSDLKTIELN